MAVHNLADEETPVSFSVSGTPRLADVFADRQYEPLTDDPYEFTVEPYGYRWLRVRDSHMTPQDDWEEIDL